MLGPGRDVRVSGDDDVGASHARERYGPALEGAAARIVRNARAQLVGRVEDALPWT
jgi:hypothetical protein